MEKSIPPGRRVCPGFLLHCLLVFVLPFLAAGCGGKGVPGGDDAISLPASRETSDPGAAAFPSPVSPRALARAKRLLSFLSPEEKCAQVLMLSIGSSRDVSAEFRVGFMAVPAGGVILLRYNLAPDPRDIDGLTSALQDLARESGRGIPLFIAVDHEGGTVFRFGRTLSRLPDASVVGKDISDEQAQALYRNAGLQLAALGFNMNFAPVLEPLNRENRDFLFHRAYGEDPERVARLGGLVIEGMREAGVLAVGKHFPGSGDGDPHDRLPVFSFDLRDREDPSILPFRRAIERHRLPAVMTSHVLVPSLDPAVPVTLSPVIQGSFLREGLGFRGIVVTDDLNMKALSVSHAPERAAVLALKAGADLIMYLAGDYARIHAALLRALETGELPRGRLDDAVVRILGTKLELDLWNRRRERSGAGSSARDARIEEFSRLKEAGDRLLGQVPAP